GIRDTQTDIVLVQRDLFVAGARRPLSVQHFSDLVNLLPLEQAFFNGLKNIALFILNDCFTHVDHDEVESLHGLIVDFAPPLFEPTAFEQTDIGADDTREVLSGLDPIRLKHRRIAIRRHDYHIDPAHDLPRIIHWNNFYSAEFGGDLGELA